MWASGLKDATSRDSSATIDADPKKAFPLFIAVSANRNPLGELTVHSLTVVAESYCGGSPLETLPVACLPVR